MENSVLDGKLVLILSDEEAKDIEDVLIKVHKSNTPFLKALEASITQYLNKL